MKKTKFINLLAIASISIGLASCGGKSTNDDNQNNEIEEETIAEPEPEEDTTINGLEPSVEYGSDEINKFFTLYKDGTAYFNSNYGDCPTRWSIKSIFDKPFIVISARYTQYSEIIEFTVYIDQNQKIHLNDPAETGYQLKRINYVPGDAADIAVGEKYTMPERFADSDSITFILAENQTVIFDSDVDKHAAGTPNWKKVEVDGKDWVLLYRPAYNNENRLVGFLISPSLESYSLETQDDNIIYEGGKLTLNDNWKKNRTGRVRKH